MDELLTVKEVSALLRMSPITIREWARVDKIPAHKVGDKWRFIREDIVDFVRAS